MPLADDVVYFVHISDSHIGPTRDYARHGHMALPCSERIVEIINDLPQRPDFVVHTGDVVTDPDGDSFKLAADVFGRLNVPVYYVCGNHDRAVDIHNYLPMGPKSDCVNAADKLTYAFEVRGQRFLVVDARGPDEIDPHGLISPAQMDVIRRECQPEGPPLTIFVHYPALPLNSMWMDAYMLMVNGEAFHQALLPARERIQGVFHGHVHQNMQTVRDGILYVSVASLFSQFSAWPGELTVGFDGDHPPGYNFVTLCRDQVRVHQHIFLRPE